MLILNRRVGEAVKIGHDIELTILEVRDRSVRVGITAPRDIAVHRDEVYQRIHGLVNQSPPYTAESE